MPDLSVVIPSRNRPERARRCLIALAGQTLAPQRWELLVCDDGSDQPLSNLLDGVETPFHFDVLRQDHAGPGAARNRAVQQAQGDILLFLNDDALPAPDLLEQHLARHAAENAPLLAVLGSFDLAAQHGRTPLGHILTHTTALFACPTMLPGKRYGYDRFYTCNLSLPSTLFRSVGGFDPDFSGPAAEDMDLGRRLEKRGAAVLYDPACRADHDHALSPADFCALNRMRGQWMTLFFLKHPELEKRPDLSTPAMSRLRQRLEAEAGAVAQALGAIQAAHRDIADPAERESAAAAIMDQVNLLHRHHYECGLLESPYLAQLSRRMDRQRPAQYDQNARRGLSLSPAKEAP